MAFKRVLIANRGEIALRILRTLRDMGIEAAIIHGREDRLSLPVRLADVAYANNKANPLDTYLDIESVITAAKEMGCDAVHPGYGFLAENATFVRRLQEEGITFIGPSADVITLLGDKIEARAAMEAAGLPTAGLFGTDFRCWCRLDPRRRNWLSSDHQSRSWWRRYWDANRRTILGI